MDTVALNRSEIHEPVPLVEARDALHAIMLQHTATNGLHILRLEVPVERVDLLAWLHAQPHTTRIYWSERRADRETAAVGVVDLVTSAAKHVDIHATIDTLQRRLAQAAPRVRYYGGLRFQQLNASDPAWQRFGAYRFVLPQFELIREGPSSTLAWNVVANTAPHALDRILETLAVAAPCGYDQVAQPLERTDLPDREGWQRNVQAALDLFANETLEKIVLARKAILSCDAPLDPVVLLRRLQTITPNSFHFCFQPESGIAFVGATPERLYGRVGRTLKSEAIAGTRPNGLTPADTKRLGDELLGSEKDVREHIFVREHIRKNLTPLCETLDIAPEPVLLKLTRRQHLISAVEGQLAPDVTDADILCSLHPTPAVGGAPTDRALEYIPQLEPFDRGWYAGPLGWIAADSAEFAVAIRSGLIDGSQIALYSGAGIVAGSTPDNEWEEIENKISDFVSVVHEA